MRNTRMITGAIVIILSVANIAWADTFDAGGANEFTIDFLNISGDASSANGMYIGSYKTFSDPSNNYRIGTYEITNDQWDKFVNSYGTVTGHPSNAYDGSATWTGTNVPISMVSWYEGAQFVNWLNTSTGHTAAYKFTGTPGTSGYTRGVWESGDAGYDSTNPYRNSNAFYFLPTEDEWVKAAYWNGTTLQTYATKAGESLTQGDGTSGTGWNYDDGGYATDPYGPWDVGSGSEELNGTFDMMGNVWEWMESPWRGGYYLGSNRGFRGGSYWSGYDDLSSFNRGYDNPLGEVTVRGFRVASVPEPTTLLLLGLGGLILRRMRGHSER